MIKVHFWLPRGTLKETGHVALELPEIYKAELTLVDGSIIACGNYMSFWPHDPRKLRTGGSLLNPINWPGAAQASQAGCAGICVPNLETDMRPGCEGRAPDHTLQFVSFDNAACLRIAQHVRQLIGAVNRGALQWAPIGTHKPSEDSVNFHSCVSVVKRLLQFEVWPLNNGEDIKESHHDFFGWHTGSMEYPSDLYKFLRTCKENENRGNIWTQAMRNNLMQRKIKDSEASCSLM